MNNLSNYAQNKLLDHSLKVAVYTPAANLYVGYSTTDPLDDGSGITEPSGNGYARKVCNVFDPTDNNKESRNTNAVTFDQATGPWGEVGYSFIKDDLVAGNFITYGPLLRPTPPTRQNTTGYNLGNFVKPSVENGYHYECTVAGISGGTEPTWPTTVGQTVLDGTVTWTCKSMQITKNIVAGNIPQIPAGSMKIKFVTGGISIYLSKKLLDHLLKVAVYTPPTHIYKLFSKSDPLDDGSGILEPVSNNYSRVMCDNWDAAVNGQSQNTNAIISPVADGDWGMITHQAKMDAPTPDDWAVTTAYSLGNFVKPTLENGYHYECTVAGTSGGTEPTWPTTVGQTVVDGTVTWTCRRTAGNMLYYSTIDPQQAVGAADYIEHPAGADVIRMN